MIIAVNFPISTSSPGLSPHPFSKGKALGTRLFQFKQLERRSLKKKSGLQRDSNPWPFRVTGAWLWATHWERGQFIEFISPVRSEMMWSIYEITHFWTAVVDEKKGLYWGLNWRRRQRPVFVARQKCTKVVFISRMTSPLTVRLIHFFRPVIGPILICANRPSAVWKLKLYGHLNSPCILSSASHKASKLLLQPALSLAHFIFPFAILKGVPGFHNDTLFMRMGPNNCSLDRTAVVLPDGVRQDISRFAWWHTTLYNMVNIPLEMLF